MFQTSTNRYFISVNQGEDSESGTGSISYAGQATVTSPYSEIKIVKDNKINPRIFFKALKNKKMSFLQNHRFNNRITKLSEQAEKALSAGQEALGDEFLRRMLVESQESILYAFNHRLFIEQDWIDKFKYKLKKNLLITPLKNFSHPIPDLVLEKLKKCQDNKLFDSYVIMHLDDGKKETTAVKKTQEEKEKDPILFGILRYSSKLYFIADWEDDYCDLTFDDIVDKLSLDEAEIKLSKNPNLFKKEQ
jgi:hypothetical protein